MERVESPMIVRNGRITVKTRTHVAAEPADLVRALSRDWGTWFKVGKTRNAIETARKLSFEFSPLDIPGMPWLRVEERQGQLALALRRARAGKKALVPVRLTAGFTGKAFFLIEKDPAGGSFITTKWAEVKPGGWRGSTDTAARLMGEAHVAMEETLLSSLDEYASALGRGGEKAAAQVADARIPAQVIGTVQGLSSRGFVKGGELGAFVLEELAGHGPAPIRLAGQTGGFMLRTGGRVFGRLLKVVRL